MQGIILSLFICLLFLSLSHTTLASPTTVIPEQSEGTTMIPDEEPTTMPGDADGAATAETVMPEEEATGTIKKLNADAKKVPGFSRDCTSVSDCEYRNALVKSTAYLNCAPSKVCICENNRFIADVSIWKLEWNGTACHIAASGPCGPDKGNELVMHCQSGLECVQGRCRDPMKLRQTPLNHSCFEDIDCVDGLVCKVTAFYFGPSTTCVARDTPALKGFEEQEAGMTSTRTPDSSTTSTSTTAATTTAKMTSSTSSSTSTDTSASTTNEPSKKE